MDNELKIKRCNFLPEGEMAIIKDTNTLIHNIVDSELKEKDKEIEELNNIIKPKEVNYNYLKLLFEKKDKEEVIKAYVYKCEQLEKLYKSYEEKEIEVIKKDNIITELEKNLEDIFYGRGQHFMDSSVVPIKYVLDKLKELKKR